MKYTCILFQNLLQRNMITDLSAEEVTNSQ